MASPLAFLVVLIVAGSTVLFAAFKLGIIGAGGGTQNFFFVGSNAILITIYLTLASRGWRTLDAPVTGEPFIWALSVPALVLVTVVDVGWGLSLALTRGRQNWLPYLLCLASLTCAVTWDFYHH
jgi:hypothetical protein